MKNNICLIKNNEKNIIGIGCFCKINLKSKSKILTNLITERKIIIENGINNSIYISFDEQKDIEIKIKNYNINKIEKCEDIIFIEIKPNADKIRTNYFNELDDNNDKDNEKKANVHILYYLSDNTIVGTFCSLLDKKIKKKDMKENRVSFSFIFSVDNNKLIGYYNEKTKKYKQINKEIIIKFFDKNENEDMEMTMRYRINKQEIKILGENFVENNKLNCRMIINNEEKEIKKELDELDLNKYEGTLDIKLKIIKPIKNLSYMFAGCEALESLIDFSKWNTNNVINMSYMFYDCESLISLPDISKWKMNNVTDISNMFCKAALIEFFLDISQWNINNVIDMSYMLSECSKLKILPDISKWNTNNITKMNYIFYKCKSLESLPDISKWNTNNVIDMSYIFYECSKLKILPDISKWNTNKIIYMNHIFYKCNSLEYLPDISKWKINNFF